MAGYWPSFFFCVFMGKAGPSCPLVYAIRTQDSLNLARLRSQPYNKSEIHAAVTLMFACKNKIENNSEFVSDYNITRPIIVVRRSGLMSC